MRRRARPAALVALLLAGAAPPADWRTIASDADRTRIRTWRQGFTKAIDMARASGDAGAVSAEGALLRPDAALGIVAPPAGAYRCRLIKVGATAAGMRDLAALPPASCRIEARDGALSLVQQGGAQQPSGRLYADGPMRMIFLGAARMGDEARALGYGGDPERSMAGIVERIGPARWRLVLPWPRWESTLQVVEINPD